MRDLTKQKFDDYPESIYLKSNEKAYYNIQRKNIQKLKSYG